MAAVTPKRHSELVTMVRKHMFVHQVSREEMCAALAMGRTTYYQRMQNPDDMSIGELRLLIKITKAPSDAEKVETINALIWGK